MKSHRKIPTPEMLSNNKEDIFEFVAIMNIKLDLTPQAKHTINTVVYNHAKHKFEYIDISPELIRFKYRLGRRFKNAHEIAIEDVGDFIFDFEVDTKKILHKQTQLKNVLEQSELGKIFYGDEYWSKLFLNTYCYSIEYESSTLIIPLSAVMIYYYVRSTQLKEAYFSANLEKLYNRQASIVSNEQAHIALKTGVNPSDASYIYRFMSNEYAHKMFNMLFVDVSTNKESSGKLSISYVGFPTLELIILRCRCVELGVKNGKTILFVREIINDDSTMDFNELVVSGRYRRIACGDGKTEEHQYRVIGRKARSATGIVRERTPSSSNAYSYISIQEPEANNSLKDKVITIREDVIVNDAEPLTIQERFDGDVDQSLLASTYDGDGSIEKCNLRGHIKAQVEKRIVFANLALPNFDKFEACMAYVQSCGLINNFLFSGVRRDIPIDKNLLKSTAFIGGRIKQLMDASFIYRGVYISLLDIENGENENSSTWVLVSDCPIGRQAAQNVLNACFVDGVNITRLNKNFYKAGHFKIERKYHPDDIDGETLEKWMITLLGKCHL